MASAAQNACIGNACTRQLRWPLSREKEHGENHAAQAIVSNAPITTAVVSNARHSLLP